MIKRRRISITGQVQGVGFRPAVYRIARSLELSGIDAQVQERTLRLVFPPGWLDANPLTVADLSREQQLVAAIDYVLEFE